MKKVKQFLLRQLTKTAVYEWFLINVAPYLRASMYYTSMRGWKYHRGYRLLKEGDIILTKDNLKATSFIIGGEWAHAGLCVAKNGVFECAEMTHLHFTKSTFADMCFESDRVAIIRCNDWDPKYVEKVIEKCKLFQDRKYDVEFALGEKYLYCSELIYLSDVDKRLKVNKEDLEQLGREYISPTGLWEAENVEVVWDSDTEIK